MEARGNSGARDSGFLVVLFPGTNIALRAESLVRAAGVHAELVPVPRQLSSDCGVCLRMRAQDRDKVEGVLTAHGIEISAIHER